MCALVLPLLLLSAPAAADGLRVGHGWAAATDGGPARAFVSIAIETAAEVAIIDVSVSGGSAVPMAPPLRSGGLVPPGADPLLPGAVLDMDPHAVHVRLGGLGPLVEGTELVPTFRADPLGPVEAIIEVEGPDAEHHSHAGHGH